MKGLLLKDYYLSKRDIIVSLVIYGVVIVELLIWGNKYITDAEIIFDTLVPTLTFGAVVPVVAVAQTLILDEKCEHIRYGFVTPVQRKEYVKEKYIFSALLIGGYTLISVILTVAIVCACPEKGVLGRIAEKWWIMLILAIVEFFFCTAAISISVKSSISKMQVRLVVFLLLGIFVLGFLTGVMAGISDEPEHRGVFRIYITVLAVLFVITWIWLFVTSFTGAEKKEL